MNKTKVLGKRKIHAQGGYSFLVTLPREWVEEHNAYEVEFLEADTGELIMKPLQVNKGHNIQRIYDEVLK